MKKIVISTLIAAMVTSSLFSVSAAAYDGVETFDHCEIYSSTEIKAIEDMSGYTAAISGTYAMENQGNPFYEEFIQNYEEFCSINSFDKNLNSLEDYTDQLFLTEYTTQSTSSVGVLRTEISAIAAACGLLGYPMIEETLSHSLQDNPSALTWNAQHEFSAKIKTSPDYQSFVNYVEEMLDDVSDSSWYKTGHWSLNSPTDVYLSIHNVDYAVSAKKDGSTWKIYIGFSDTYDYEPAEYGNSGLAPLVEFANNFAAEAMAEGAMNPYKILAYMQETY